MSLSAPVPVLDEPTPSRFAPVQERSRKTVDKLVRAAKELLADPEVGRDRFTTAMVAERAGVSIGTFYRYFSDRVDLLDAIWLNRRDSYLELAD